jgi:hypothetical protein
MLMVNQQMTKLQELDQSQVLEQSPKGI